MTPGLNIEHLARGSGPTAAAGHTAVVHYTGWLLDGTRFDSSLDRQEPFEFVLGAGQVIAGWDEGGAQMRVGDTVKLTVPPESAYGEAGYPGVIPNNATLVFEIQLIEVRPP